MIKNIKRLCYAIKFMVGFMGLAILILRLKGVSESGITEILKGVGFLGITLMFLLDAYSMVREFSSTEGGVREKIYLGLKVLIWFGGAYYFGYLGVSALL
ncbi:hypothetical protein [Porphyromonas sp.]|uniref:hypothetical protein n=1 Tax=Porphyromonas sp. TaxID=1924944 RepID=UPI0026DD5FC3|nr:hypothetical protein [Porphyromonas sp.]MDO4770662.1 hypothetical protein [Porphyromonas sp.]